MITSQPPPTPYTAPRHAGLDVARGLAIAGMAIVNFDLSLTGEGGPAWLDSFTAAFQGRASALFVLLAGIGIGLLTRSRGVHAARIVARRGVVLLALGFAFLLLWPADILHFYGFWFLLAVPCLRLSPARLRMLALFVVLLFPLALMLGVDYERHWDFTSLYYSDQWSLDGIVRHLLFNGFHPSLPWFGFLLLGLSIGPLLLAPKAPLLRVALGAGLTAWAVELSSRALVSCTQDQDLALLFGTDSMPPGPLYMLASSSSAVAVLALCLAWSRCAQGESSSSPLLRLGEPLRQTLAAAGRVALSLYLLHVLTGILPFYWNAEAASSSLARTTVVAGWAVWCGLAFLLARWWVTAGHSGPAEFLFRKLSMPRQDHVQRLSGERE